VSLCLEIFLRDFWIVGDDKVSHELHNALTVMFEKFHPFLGRKGGN